MKTVHTFRIVEDEGCLIDGRNGEQIYPQTDMSIESGASIEDMLYAFERFLEATGYVLPDGVLDFVVNDPFPTSYAGSFNMNKKDEGGNFGNV